jgi:hypothetical protein
MKPTTHNCTTIIKKYDVHFYNLSLISKKNVTSKKQASVIGIDIIVYYCCYIITYYVMKIIIIISMYMMMNTEYKHHHNNMYYHINLLCLVV